MHLVNIENGFSLIENDKVVFSHTIDNPAIFIGKGKEKMDIYKKQREERMQRMRENRENRSRIN